MFKCDRCGCCCRNVDKSELYSDLDRGDGTCKYLVDNLCSIYDSRPLFCRIDLCYELFFSDSMSYKEYCRLNTEVCQKLKKENEGK
ncbi:MAG: YkgJ family cysteine cluster protein [Clostridia bacterium]|nr:YkgJ family cysteine cluster protein [Clostridia bacterium]